MADVAKAVGVSQATVSLVLNDVGGSRVHPATAEAVRQAARRIGYSITRRAPVGRGATQSIGYIIEDTLTNPMVNIAIEAARRAAWDAGCVLLVLPTQGDSRLGAEALDLLLEQRLAGVIVSSFFTNRIRPPSRLRDVRAVLVNCYTKDRELPAVLPSHSAGARAGVEHLISRGHRRIGMVNGPEWMDAFRDRAAGYRRALKAAGLAFDPTLLLSGEASLVWGRRGAAGLLAADDPPTALFCASDQLALGAYEEIRARGLAVGRDVAVLGFDDDPSARAVDPALTTVRVPHEEMGRRAVRHLLALRDGLDKGVLRGHVRLKAPLVVRNST